MGSPGAPWSALIQHQHRLRDTIGVLKHWLALSIFAVGASFGLITVLKASHHQNAGVWFDLSTPGLFLSFQVMMLMGGVHGNYVNIWDWMIIPCNGIAYFGIVRFVMWIKHRAQRLRGGTKL